MKTKLGEFSLGKIEFKPKEIVEIQYAFVPKEGVSTPSTKSKYENYPHPNLRMHFEDQLKDCVIKVDAYARFIDVINNGVHVSKEEKEAFDKLSFVQQQYIDSLKKAIRVFALEAKGGSTTTSVIIHYYYNPYRTSGFAKKKTQSINLDAEVFGIESDLADMYADVESEAYQYIFENKGGEVSMNLTFDSDGVTEE